ncbi:hypothetical protein LPJ66_003108 [Kickxella alabastrina]|uniref:Uncharacterized protein n=1 Tax=Kickxella alabastrina TaxID=61397 RepID=A0ACC1INI4_9FUNG|nr:hypothetical protein LPJ66_003108 [Kickxella alabastrina]
MSPGLTITKPMLKVKAKANGSGSRVDALLAKQGKADKVLLRRRIEFRVAQQSDAKMDQLRKKYKPINMVSTSSSSSNTNGSSAQPGTAASSLEGGLLDQSVDGLIEKSGFRRAAHSLFPSERLAATWRQVRAIGPGLSNLGNTCFLNSVLQCLTYTSALAEYMLMREHSASCRVGDNCILCKFEAHVVRALSKRESSSIAPKPIVGRLKLVAKHMRVGRQEDSHEFLRLLVEAFQRNLLHGIDPKIDRRIQETTLVHQVFGGYLQSQVKCSRCGHDSNTFEPLLDISLDIQSGGGTIAKALRAFTRPEMLTKSNRYKCEKCAKLVDATKQMTVYRLPRVLTLQLKRFSIFGGGKINRYVEFPLSLNMKGYVSGNSPEAGPHDYSLYAVLVHSGGTARSGHYFCYVKSSAGVWYEMNDSMVHQVSERTVLKQTAYLLFYERCQPTKADRPVAAAAAADKKNKKDNLEVSERVVVDKSVSKIALASDDMEAIVGGEMKDKKKKLRDASGLPQLPSTVNSAVDGLAKKSKKAKKAAAAAAAAAAAMEINQILQTPSAELVNPKRVPIKKPMDTAVEKITADLADSKPSEWVVREKAKSKPVGSDTKVINWNDDTASKSAKVAAIEKSKAATSGNSNGSWSIAEVRPNRSSQYGTAVDSWTGSDSVADVIAGNKSADERRSDKKRNRRPDFYDSEYDRGRTKKIKQPKANKFAATINPFQKVGERISKKH